ncbi:hypothetical protein V2J09_004884 [Rumex salicifolius]
MATELALKAKDAFFDDDYDLAVDLLTQASNLDPENADLYADRSQAHIKLNNFTEAVADANKAIQLDPTIASAYYRKGVACMKLEEYHTAKAALEKGASLSGDDSKFSKFIKECDQKIAAEIPEIASSVSCAAPVSVETTEVEQINTVEVKHPTYRHGHYQSAQEVVVTIYAKGVPAEHVTVDFGEQILSVTIDVPGEVPYHFQPRLFGKIIPDKCKFSVRSTTVEIRLVKVEAIQWTSLEYSNKVVVPQKAYSSPGDSSYRPTYPSSKPKRTDWDKLEAQVKKEEKEEKLDGDAALNKFFSDIYGDADEDMRRAMNKSFVESSGTVLSTNWKDVGKKKIESTPPDGMELKKWEY